MKEKINFLCNLFEHYLQHHVISNNTTEIDRFLRVDFSSDGISPANTIHSLLFDIFVHQETDLFPLELAAHLEYSGYNLTFVSPLKKYERDEGVPAFPAVLEFPPTDLDELARFYHIATEVERLEFRLFAYQLQICKMEWRTLGTFLEGSVTEISTLSWALNLPNLQYLMTSISEKNVMWSLLGTLFDLNHEKGKDEVVEKGYEERQIQDPFVYQLKISRIYALLLVALPVPDRSSWRTDEQLNQTHNFKAEARIHRRLSQVDVLDALTSSRPHISLVTRIWEVIKTTPNIFSIFESISRLSTEEGPLHQLEHADMQAAKNRFEVTAEFLVDGMYSLLMIFFRLESHAYL